MKTLSILLLFGTALLGWQLQSQTEDMDYDQVISNGMVFRWKVVNDSLKVSLRAPTSGWVAVGFNRHSGIVGSALIMGAQRQGKSVVEEQFVTGPRIHPPVESLGGKPSLNQTRCQENKGMTEMEFSLPLKPADEWHCDLQSEGPIYVALAYSREDDFQHHSAVRTEVKIELR